MSNLNWPSIGTVVGNTSTDEFTFILQNMSAKLGDIVAVQTQIPADDNTKLEVTVWGRIISIDRFNPFFPAEAAQELANNHIDLLDTVLSTTRDHLEASVLIIGRTGAVGSGDLDLVPPRYPVKPSASVLYPSAEAVKELLNAASVEKKKLHLGNLIGRADVDVSLTASQVVSRHMAILAMTGGGKTVASRRVIKELANLKYPIVIFDPHGDYLGLYEKRAELGADEVKLVYPEILVTDQTRGTVSDLVSKMGNKITEAQAPLNSFLIEETEIRGDVQNLEDFIQDMIDELDRLREARTDGGNVPPAIRDLHPASFNPVKRNFVNVKKKIEVMRKNNERLREKFTNYDFLPLPDPSDEPEKLVAKGQITIFYLAGFDHLTQSTIASLVLEKLFEKRANLTNDIPPFQIVLEEAHNFIPSRSEGTDGTPSLATVRKIITEGRKFGTGMLIISQRPSRLDETILAQCNSFLVLRLVNPKDKSFVRSVMENLSESDANILQTFGQGQGIVSGQAVRFPLLIQVKFDEDLISQSIGNEDFINEVASWTPPQEQKAKKKTEKSLESLKENLKKNRHGRSKNGGGSKLNF